MKSMPKRSDGGGQALKPKVIKTEAEYQATLARIEAIFDAKPGTAKERTARRLQAAGTH